MLKDVFVLNIQSRVGGLTKYLKKLSNQWKNGTEQETNKRAQTALGRSPEKKIKGHSGAINREPQGHN